MAKSHIIPKSMYGGGLQDQSGPMRLYSSQKHSKPKRIPIGVYDTEILCIDCETSLSDWDNYANDLLYRQTPQPCFYDEGKPNALRYDDIDHNKLLMFFVSLLWRMHQSNHQMFTPVRLGKYEAIFKSAIKNRNRIKIPELDVIIDTFDHTSGEIVQGPRKQKIDGLNCYRVYLAKYRCWIKVDQRPFFGTNKLLSLSNGNPFHTRLIDFVNSNERKSLTRLVKRNRH